MCIRDSFRSMTARVANRAELERVLNEIFAAEDVAHWIERIEAADIPTCRVNSLRDVFALPQLRENGTLVRVPHPTRGEIEVLSCPVKMSATPTAVTRGAPTLGEHTDEVLESLGIGADERSALRERGVLGG